MATQPPTGHTASVQNNQGVVAAHIEALHVHNQPVQTYEYQLAEYYRKVAKECRVATLEEHHPAGRETVSSESAVAQIYVEPDVWRISAPQNESASQLVAGARADGPEHRERMPWQDCFNSQDAGLRRLLLVAEGGMGKTTAVDVQIQRLVEKGSTPWMALRLPRVLVVGSNVGADDVVEVALSYDIASKLDLKPSQTETVAYEVLNRLDKTPGVILLDALDEVPRAERPRVVAAVLRFLNKMWDRQPDHKVLITSRPYAVEGGGIQAELEKFNFTKLELARLSEAQRGELVEKYFAVRGRDARVGAALLRQLNDANDGDDFTIGELMREPMLATYACMLAEAPKADPAKTSHDKPLPNSRHELLEGVVRLLLERWDVRRRDSDQTGQFEALFQPGQSAELGGRSPLRHVLEQAALQQHLYAAQEDSAKRSTAARPVGHGFPIPDELDLGLLHEAVYSGAAHEALNADWLIARLDEQMPSDMPLRAHHIYEWLVRRSGLVSLTSGPRGKARPSMHRQLEDFLAAAGLWAAKMDATEYASELTHSLKVSPDWSRDLIAQGWERLVAASDGVEKKLLPALKAALDEWEAWCESVNAEDCDAGTAIFALALARSLPHEWLKIGSNVDQSLTALRKRLVAIVEQQRLSAPERAAAADALGTLGDPRFAQGLWLPAQRFGRNSEADEPLPGFVRVQAGTFWVGEDGRDDNPPHEASIESDFYVARSLTTVAQYRRFVDAGAYGAWPQKQDTAIWGESGLAWRRRANEGEKGERSELRQPRAWAAQLGFLHRPVVNVSWWEARAYARWLNTDPVWLQEKEAVAAWRGYQVGLPTELQWERTARMDMVGGAHRSPWPWGDEVEDIDRRANLDDSGVCRLTPAGCFAPNPFGVWDLAGNAWEWMDNAVQDPAHVPRRLTAADEPTLGNKRYPALRGGSWDLTAVLARASVRSRDLPGSWLSLVGFRVVLSLGEANSEN